MWDRHEPGRAQSLAGTAEDGVVRIRSAGLGVTQFTAAEPSASPRVQGAVPKTGRLFGGSPSVPRSRAVLFSTRAKGRWPVFDKFRPEALHERLWPTLVVIALIGAFGVILLLSIG